MWYCVTTLAAMACLTGSLLLAPLSVAAQPAHHIFQIGILANAPKSYKSHAYHMSRFRDGLRSLGYVESRNVKFLYRYPSSMSARPAELPVLARQLVALKPDVILTAGEPAIDSIYKATHSIPIVAAVGANVVVKNFSHPEGNLTGLSSDAPKLVGKELQIFHEVIPSMRKIALLWDPRDRPHRREVERAEKAANALGLALVPVPAGNPADFAPAFEKMADEHVDGVMVLRGGLFVNSRPKLSNLATAHGLPSMFGHPAEAEAGGLIAYGTNLGALFERAANYVAKILEGTRPADLPVESPTKFDLVVNLKTAKALGIMIPRLILLQADEVIH